MPVGRKLERSCMSQINRPSQFIGLESTFQGLNRNYNTAKAVNGGIDFGESTQTAQGDGTAYSGNVNGQWANITAPGTANTEFAIPHNLNRIPSFYLYNIDRAVTLMSGEVVGAVLYQLPDTGTAWTQTNIYVKCSAASAKLRVFIS
jgi:hypothetical protein